MPLLTIECSSEQLRVTGSGPRHLGEGDMAVIYKKETHFFSLNSSAPMMVEL